MTQNHCNSIGNIGIVKLDYLFCNKSCLAPSWTSLLSNHAVILFFSFKHVECSSEDFALVPIPCSQMSEEERPPWLPVAHLHVLRLGEPIAHFQDRSCRTQHDWILLAWLMQCFFFILFYFVAHACEPCEHVRNDICSTWAINPCVHLPSCHVCASQCKRNSAAWDLCDVLAVPTRAVPTRAPTRAHLTVR